MALPAKLRAVLATLLSAALDRRRYTLFQLSKRLKTTPEQAEGFLATLDKAGLVDKANCRLTLGGFAAAWAIRAAEDRSRPA